MSHQNLTPRLTAFGLAAALALTLATAAPAATVVIEDKYNGDSGAQGNATLTGGWLERSDNDGNAKAGDHGSSSHISDNSSDTAEFAPTLPSSGIWAVEAWWPTGNFGAAPLAQIDVTHNGGTDAHYVDPSSGFVGRGKWVGVAIADLPATGASATVYGGNGGFMAADAVRFNDDIIGVTFGVTEDMGAGVYTETGDEWSDSSNGHRISNEAGEKALYDIGPFVHASTESVTFDINMDWFGHSSRDDNATINIYDGDVSTLVSSLTVNMEGTMDKALGEFTFTSGNPLVEIVGSGEGYAEAGPITFELTDYIIPEPATLALLGLGGAVMLTGRKCRA